MKIAIAQTESIKGDIHGNIQNHLNIIKRSNTYNADLIIFPELSITGYEPEIAKEYATEKENNIFNPFQELSDAFEVTIGIGMPTKVENGINISMIIFQPRKDRTMYSKQLLHSDELPYFTCGSKQVYLNLKGKKIALGICYETLQREHFVNAKKDGAEIYIASVAKSENGISKAYEHFPQLAREFKTPIFMANCVGYCDDFLSIGSSSVWNGNGQLVQELDDRNQGLIVYDIKNKTSDFTQFYK